MSRLFRYLLFVDKGDGNIVDYFGSGHLWDFSSLLSFTSALSYEHNDWKFYIHEKAMV